MPNWCANRLMFNGIQNSDALKTWIAGGEPSLHRRARKKVSSFSWRAARGYCVP